MLIRMEIQLLRMNMSCKTKPINPYTLIIPQTKQKLPWSVPEEDKCKMDLPISQITTLLSHYHSSSWSKIHILSNSNHGQVTTSNTIVRISICPHTWVSLNLMDHNLYPMGCQLMDWLGMLLEMVKLIRRGKVWTVRNLMKCSIWVIVR